MGGFSPSIPVPVNGTAIGQTPVVEEGTTNLILFSNDLTNGANWTAVNCQSINNIAAENPIGGQVISQIVSGAGLPSRLIQTVALLANNRYTFSTYIRFTAASSNETFVMRFVLPSGLFYGVRFDVNGNVASQSPLIGINPTDIVVNLSRDVNVTLIPTPTGQQFIRVALSVTIPNGSVGTTDTAIIVENVGAIQATWQLWGVQCELNPLNGVQTGSLPSSPIGTKAATIARATGISTSGLLNVANAVPNTAGGNTQAGLVISNAAGIYSGSGAPTINAARNSLYIRTDGATAATRLYINTDGANTWTNFTASA